MATDLAPVTPAVLRWARERLKIDEETAARRAGVTVDRLVAWETGEQMPTLRMLRDLGKLYQRPISVFFLPDPPTDFDPVSDFRRLPDADSRIMSLALHRVLRRAVEQQEIAAELLEDEDASQVDVGLASLSTPVVEAGIELRSRIGIAVEEQQGWPNPDTAFAAWLEAVEGLGVLILRTSDVDSAEFRGFSLAGDVPVIVINALDYPRGQTFTLMHELGHLMLRDSGICNLLDDPDHQPEVERWCNALAAEVLMPAADFLADLGAEAVPARAWTDASIEWMSARWSVSQEAVARRLQTLGLATPEFYEEKRAQYQAGYAAWRDEERRRRSSRKNKGGPPPATMTARDRGKPYVRLVLDAFHRDVLTASSASSILGLKVRHFPALERAVRS